MASYLSRHPRTGWRYQRHIPADVRPLIGGKRSVSVKYIPDMNRRDAERQARAYAVQDDKEWSSLRNLSPAEAAHVIAIGGIDKVINAIPEWESGAALSDRIVNGMAGVDEHEIVRKYEEELAKNPYLPEEPDMTVEAFAKWKSQLMTRASRTRYDLNQRLQRAKPIAEKIDLANSEYSLDALFRLWVKVREPRNSRKHAAVVKGLKTVLGDVDYRKVTQLDITKYRDHLATLSLSKRSQRTYLTEVSTLFSAAVSENKITVNPAVGVKVHGRMPSGKASEDRPFTGAEERLIFAKTAESSFGGKRHAEAMWMLRLLAWTGARPNEIAQLRKCDVNVENGIPFIHIRAGHPEQHVKTGDSRKVPLHDALADFVDYAHKTQDFIFGVFPFDKNNGRAAWLTSNFGKFLRQTCEIEERKKTLYSFRHRFIDATRNALVPEELSKMITGHSSGDIHGTYGKGAALKVLADEMAKVNPLAD